MMTADEASTRILDALRLEIRKHWGHIGKKEAEVHRSGGYLSKILRRSWAIPLNILLDTLEAFEIDPATLL